MIAVVEIPKGVTILKAELLPNNTMKYKSFSRPTYYPANYGFITDTLAPDGDALDTFIIGPRLETLSRVKVEHLAILFVEDQEGEDNKVICKPKGMTTTYAPFAWHVEAIVKLLETYKLGMDGKFCKVLHIGDREDAIEEIAKCKLG